MVDSENKTKQMKPQGKKKIQNGDPVIHSKYFGGKKVYKFVWKKVK